MAAGGQWLQGGRTLGAEGNGGSEGRDCVNGCWRVSSESERGLREQRQKAGTGTMAAGR